MKMLVCFLIVSVFTSPIALSEELERLPDIAPMGRIDTPSAKEVESVEEELFQIFGDQSFEAEDFVAPLQIFNKYSHIDPTRIVPANLLASALSAYDRNRDNFPNDRYITVVDFSKRSNKARFFVIDMSSGQVWPLRTAHGSGGDLNHDGYVEKVSNVSGSHTSSKGFYRVSEIYYGKYGRSIRLDGLSSTNSRARARAIVLHGSDYVQERNVIQGRSWGCFVLAWSVKDDAVSKIAGGSLLYADFSGQR
jgi:hypothetical protein